MFSSIKCIQFHHSIRFFYILLIYGFGVKQKAETVKLQRMSMLSLRLCSIKITDHMRLISIHSSDRHRGFTSLNV